MNGLINFFLAFLFSFVGSIPPGTINLTLLQLSFEKKTKAAIKFAFAASIIEYPYGWVAVKFQDIILDSPVINENLHLIAAVVMIALGILAVLASKKHFVAKAKDIDDKQRGFRKGLVIGILNPLAIPYWVAITAFLKSENLLNELSGVALHFYLIGVFLGAFSLLMLIIFLGIKLTARLADNPILTKIPGVVLLLLGLLSLFRYLTPRF